MSKKKPNTIKLGNIHLGKTVLITDPCYDRGTWCAGTLNILPGEYVARMTKSDQGDWGTRISSVSVTREGSKAVRFYDSGIDVGVDSGQAGIFDDSVYPHGDFHDKNNTDFTQFYDDIGKLTIGVFDKNRGEYGDYTYPQGGIYKDKGVVTSSGFGDGSYQCIVGEDENGDIVYIRINYIYFKNFK